MKTLKFFASFEARLLFGVAFFGCASSMAETPGCKAEPPAGINFNAETARSNTSAGGTSNIMNGVNFRRGVVLGANRKAGSNVFVYSHCIGGPTGVGETKWTEFDKWDPTEKKEVAAMAAGCQMPDIFGKDMKRWLGPEGVKCAAKNFVEYAKKNPNVKVHFECDNMTYLKPGFGGREIDAYKLFVEEIKKSGACNLAIVPKNLKNDEFAAVRKIDPKIISNIGARETVSDNPPDCERVDDMIIAQNPDSKTGQYKLTANPKSCEPGSGGVGKQAASGPGKAVR